MRQAFAKPAVVLLLLLIGCTSFEGSPGSSAEKVPGHYAPWRTVDDNACGAVAAFINRLPDQSIAAASNSRAPGFLRWAGDPLYVLRRSNMADVILPIMNTSLVSEQGARSSWLLRYSASIAGTADDMLYVLPAGAPLPASADEMRALLKSREPVFATFIHNKIERLKKNHGAAWSDWMLPGQAAVSGIEIKGRMFFLAESPYAPSRSSRILVFSLSPEGARDLCMLRRICSCAESCTKDLTPSDAHCREGQQQAAV